MEIKDFLIEKYSQLPLKNEGYFNYYYFIENEFKTFIEILEKVDEISIKTILKSSNQILHFNGNCTRRRLCNLTRKICKEFLEILALCYKGDIFTANKELSKALTERPWSSYLIESYENNISFELLPQKKVFYRMRDEDGVVDNCLHVPYDKRKNASSGRFSMLGYPCLYLGDCVETCNAEIGELQKNSRWVGKFTLRKPILLYDLRIPSKEEISNAGNYELFRMLLAYPLVVLCSSKTEFAEFNEEYYIPQLLFHYILMSSNKETNHIGIIYSSTKRIDGYNIVIPALYKEKEPPKNGYSKFIKEIFDTDQPTIYKHINS